MTGQNGDEQEQESGSFNRSGMSDSYCRMLRNENPISDTLRPLGYMALGAALGIGASYAAAFFTGDNPQLYVSPAMLVGSLLGILYSI